MLEPQKIREMFDEIASKYDFMNDLISLKLHHLIKRFAISKISVDFKSRALDLCCGSGDIAALLVKNKKIFEVIGVDFSEKMIEVAKSKNKNKNVKFINADCLNLPFEDGSFDIITMSFGLRNIPDKSKALSEIVRVLKNNGIFFHLDFSKANFLVDYIFSLTTKFFSKIFCKNTMPYEYLINSKKMFYSSNQLKDIFLKSGLVCVQEYKFLFSMITVMICKNSRDFKLN